MLILEEDSSVQYKGNAYQDTKQYNEEKEEETKQNEEGHNISEHQDNGQKEQDAGNNDKTTETDDVKDNNDGQFDDEEYEGVFLQKVVLCNMQDKAGIPASWILLESVHYGCCLQFKNAD